jgi:hypothetical protein
VRTSLELSRISTLANVLRQNRGDTNWDDNERQAVTDALALLEAIPATQIRSRPLSELMPGSGLIGNEELCDCGHPLDRHVAFATHPDKRVCFDCLTEPAMCVLPPKETS